MKFFGSVDKTKDGRLRSEMPAWYFQQHREELEESIRHKKYQLDHDLVPLTEKNLMKERLKQEEGRLNEIDASKPKITDIEKNVITKGRNDLGKKIKDSMFTRSEMERGVADAHEEARRMSDPIIKVDSKEESELLSACEIEIKDGKVSRDQASKAWKIGSRLLDESSNVEVLRKG
jgi:hypothetical protein